MVCAQLFGGWVDCISSRNLIRVFFQRGNFVLMVFLLFEDES